MLLPRLLKYINWGIALLLAAALAVVWWYAWRPLAQTSGTLQAPVSDRVSVKRDSLGVAHIEARTLDDAVFAQGYVTAQDRLWQMDTLRRLAGGDLAEIIGPDALESDKESRAFRLRRIAEEQSRNLDPRDRALMAAYARGVNHYIETHRNRMPVEFSVLGYDPRPWSIVDSLLAGLHMFRILTAIWKDEIQKETMLASGDPAKVNALYPVRTGQEIQPGSNAWVIAGSRSATGRPILANDTHLEWTFPSTWYMVRLKSPEVNVTGFTLPGLPMVIIGHNDRIAWGVTNLQFDVQDLYLEKLEGKTGRYEFAGAVQQAQLDRDSIAIRGRRPADFTTWVTRHGPVLVSKDTRIYSLRWVAAQPGGFRFPFVDVNRARNWAEFRSALALFTGPAQNFVYADRDGNIGYQAAGRLPVRQNFTGDVPVDGSSGKFEWAGFIPFDRLPSAFNPSAGAIVSANQNPFPRDYEFQVSGNFAAHHRSTQIRQRLDAQRGWKPEEMLSIQTDVYSELYHYLARRVNAAWERRKPDSAELMEAVNELKKWNGQMTADGAAPMIASLIYQHLRKAIVERASSGSALTYDREIAPAVIEGIVRSESRDWFPDYDQLLIEVLHDAVAEGRRLQGRNLGRWDYGNQHVLRLAHPLLSRAPLIGRYFRLPAVELSGNPTTVKQNNRRLGPSMRMVVDLSDWERSLANVSVGQSGQVLSSHYKDQFDAHMSGRSFPMQYEQVDARDTLILEPAR